MGLCTLGLDRGSDVGMCWSVRVRRGRGIGWQQGLWWVVQWQRESPASHVKRRVALIILSLSSRSCYPAGLVVCARAHPASASGGEVELSQFFFARRLVAMAGDDKWQQAQATRLERERHEELATRAAGYAWCAEQQQPSLQRKEAWLPEAWAWGSWWWEGSSNPRKRGRWSTGENWGSGWSAEPIASVEQQPTPPAPPAAKFPARSPEEDKQALRMAALTPAAFIPQRHVMMALGRPVMVLGQKQTQWEGLLGWDVAWCSAVCGGLVGGGLGRIIVLWIGVPFESTPLPAGPPQHFTPTHIIAVVVFLSVSLLFS